MSLRLRVKREIFFRGEIFVSDLQRLIYNEIFGLQRLGEKSSRRNPDTFFVQFSKKPCDF